MVRPLGFQAAGRLKKIDVSGGPSEVIVSDVTNQIGSGSWNAEGTILFSQRGSNLAEVSAAGGQVSVVTAMDESLMEENHVWPEFLPDERHYLYPVRAGTQLELQVYIGELGSRNRTLLLTGVTRAQYAPPRERWPGYLLYVRDGTLMAQPFAADRLAFTGPPVAIANSVATTAVGTGGDFSVAANGTLAYRVGDAAKQELAWFQPPGRKSRRPLRKRLPGRIGAGMRRSPDGTTAAYTWLTGQQPDIMAPRFHSRAPDALHALTRAQLQRGHRPGLRMAGKLRSSARTGFTEWTRLVAMKRFSGKTTESWPSTTGPATGRRFLSHDGTRTVQVVGFGWFLSIGPTGARVLHGMASPCCLMLRHCMASFYPVAAHRRSSRSILMRRAVVRFS